MTDTVLTAACPECDVRFVAHLALLLTTPDVPRYRLRIEHDGGEHRAHLDAEVPATA